MIHTRCVGGFVGCLDVASNVAATEHHAPAVRLACSPLLLHFPVPAACIRGRGDETQPKA